MALHFNVLVNGERIGFVYIRRHGLVNVCAGSTYECEVEYPTGVTRRAIVTHNYDDGALVLIQKALAAVNLDQ